MNKFVQGGVADIQIGEPSYVWQHRINMVTGQLMAHAALTTLLSVAGLPPRSTLSESIRVAQENDLISPHDAKMLRDLNTEANVAKHRTGDTTWSTS